MQNYLLIVFLILQFILLSPNVLCIIIYIYYNHAQLWSFIYYLL